MIGLDTGFFIELINGDEEAVNLWKSGIVDETEFATHRACVGAANYRTRAEEV